MMNNDMMFQMNNMMMNNMMANNNMINQMNNNMMNQMNNVMMNQMNNNMMMNPMNNLIPNNMMMNNVFPMMNNVGLMNNQMMNNQNGNLWNLVFQRKNQSQQNIIISIDPDKLFAEAVSLFKIRLGSTEDFKYIFNGKDLIKELKISQTGLQNNSVITVISFSDVEGAQLLQLIIDYYFINFK